MKFEEIEKIEITNDQLEVLKRLYASKDFKVFQEAVEGYVHNYLAILN